MQQSQLQSFFFVAFVTLLAFVIGPEALVTPVLNLASLKCAHTLAFELHTL